LLLRLDARAGVEDVVDMGSPLLAAFGVGLVDGISAHGLAEGRAAAKGIVPVPAFVVDIGQNGEAVGALAGLGRVEISSGDPLGVERARRSSSCSIPARRSAQVKPSVWTWAGIGRSGGAAQLRQRRRSAAHASHSRCSIADASGVMRMVCTRRG
jgi:hypothetical protein